jgi:hypothetical protein
MPLIIKVLLLNLFVLSGALAYDPDQRAFQQAQREFARADSSSLLFARAQNSSSCAIQLIEKQFSSSYSLTHSVNPDLNYAPGEHMFTFEIHLETPNGLVVSGEGTIGIKIYDNELGSVCERVSYTNDIQVNP